ncbi:MAG: FG-GAP repeat protein [Planctomycetes bacterium]|nr:FG-GAP repeat protein [Planctomycetota bacterium]
MRVQFSCLVATLITVRASLGGDFNGDGFEDLAVSAPRETIAGVVDAGSVHVIPGSASGADTASAFRIDAITLGALPEQTLALGAALAWGDFDGDGFDDLAIGSPSAHVKGLIGAGRVFVLPGSASGFDFARLRSFDQNSKGIKDKVESDGTPGQSSDAFGAELVTGDFDGNGFDDLAINAEAEAIGKVKGAGAVHVLYGSSSGLRSKRNQLWHQNSSGIKDKCENAEQWGSRMAAGDLNGDGRDELILSCPMEATSSPGIGRAAVLFGSKKGLRAKGNLLLKPESASIPLTDVGALGVPTLACGDFDGDGFFDLAIGMTGMSADVNGLRHGVVYVARGSATGPATVMDSFAQGVDGVPGTGANSDEFGSALSVANFDGDAQDDLAIAAFGESLPDGYSGSVTVLYGSPTGIGVTGADVFDQSTAGISGVPEEFDQFGSAIAGVDFDGDGVADLAIGVPFEDLGVTANAGALHLLFGTTIAGLTTGGNVLLDQDSPGIFGSVGAGHQFGGAFAQ